MSLIPLLLTAAAQEEPAKPIPLKDGANTVAVVIGLSSYESLPDPAELDFARSDAAVVHKALKEKAGFTHTFLLTDGEATKESIRTLLRTEIAQLVGPNDLFLLYFVGHGVGSDLDEPTLLVFDSSVTNAQESGLELQAFAEDLQLWTQAGRTLIVTDAIHKNQLDGIYFFGPAANQWPALRDGTMIISSSQADSPAKDGGFGTVFADAVGGAADASNDGMVTGQELMAYLERRITPIGQIPIAAGNWQKGAVISQGVKNDGATDPSATNAPIPDANALFPDVDVWSAKFVFREGASQTVQCRNKEVVSCAPSCYVRDFKAGICNVTAVVDGSHLKGKISVVAAGKYDCGLKAGLLNCKPPIEAAKRKDSSKDDEG